jgi:hypothetical protein
MPFQHACFISCQAEPDEQVRRSIEAFAQLLGEALKPLRREPVYFNPDRLTGRFDEPAETAALYRSVCLVVVYTPGYFDDSVRFYPPRELLAMQRLEQERLDALGEKPGPGGGLILVVFAQEGETVPAPLGSRITLESPLLGPALAQMDRRKLPKALPQFERLAQTIATWCSRFDAAPHLFDGVDHFHLPDQTETLTWLQQFQPTLTSQQPVNQTNAPPLEPAANIAPVETAEPKPGSTGGAIYPPGVDTPLFETPAPAGPKPTRRRTKAAEEVDLSDLSGLAIEEDDLSGLVGEDDLSGLATEEDDSSGLAAEEDDLSGLAAEEDDLSGLVGEDDLSSLAAEPEPPTPLQQQANVPPDTKTPDTQQLDTETLDTETLDTETPPLRPEQLTLSPSAETILRAAAALLGISPDIAQENISGARPPGSPQAGLTTLLLAMDQLGRRQQASQTLRFLADQLARSPAESYQALYRATFSFDPATAPAALASLPPLETALERLDPAAAAVVREAETIAQQTNDSRDIHARHLLAALLLDRAGELAGTVERLGLNLPRLRDAFLVFVERLPLDLTPEAWLALFPAARAARGLRPSFDADIFADRDYLDIKRHVEALASLIAARDIAPPLSIGLFGEWGSGKTFFMQQLMQAVARKAKEAQAAPQLQKEIAFYKRIVQIEFNAWHYVEGNLWASLVEHIFTSLRESKHAPQTQVEQAQEALLKELGVEQQAQAVADARMEAVNQQLDQADQAVAEARRKYEEQARELQRFTAENIMETILGQPGARETIKEVRQKLGLPELELETANLKEALAEAQATLEQGRSLLSTLLGTPDGRRRLGWLALILFVAPLLGLGIGWLLEQFARTQGFAQLSAWLSSAAGVLGGGAEWLRQQGGWLSQRFKQVKEAERQLETGLAEKQAQLQSQIVAKEKALELLKEEYVAAQQAKNEAQQRVAQVKAELAQTTPSRLLADFIQQRVESGDYRKHLGVLALVRQDFKRLSDLIVEENRKLLQVQTLAEERRDEQYYINRIVLYIDDLDRCPPANVVQVLQAVHLLLAFPLFVVVVAVDARWISRSLQARYKELLGNGQNDAETLEASFWGGSATPLDYLEKIFQIPFWLNPMDSASSRRMLRGLLKPNLATLPPSGEDISSLPRSGVGAPPGRSASTPERSGDEPSSPSPSSLEAQAEPPTPIQQQANLPPDAAQPDTEQLDTKTPDTGQLDTKTPDTGQLDTKTPDTEPPTPPPDLNPAALTIWPAELAYVEQLAPLLGRSPRALKRFVNIYRLIKMSLSEMERRAFLLEGHTEGEFKLVMFLLALVTNSPGLAALFCRQVEALAHEPAYTGETQNGVQASAWESQLPYPSPAGVQASAWESRAKTEPPAKASTPLPPETPPDDLERLCARLDLEPALQHDPDWQRVKAWLQPAKGRPPLQADIEQLFWWSHRVARYSFLLDPGLRPARSPLVEVA